jgi:hypothetical protein
VFWLTELLSNDGANTVLDQVRAQARSSKKDKKNAGFPSLAARKAKAATKDTKPKAAVWVQQETFPELKPSLRPPQLQKQNAKSASSAGLVWDAPQNTTKSADVAAETEVKQTVSKKGGKKKKKWMPVSLKNIA